MREGEAADKVFMLRSGRVDVIDEGPPEALIRTLRRGDVLGELALLRAGQRSVSARARRDHRTARARAHRVRGTDPGSTELALGLMRAMGAQLDGQPHSGGGRDAR